MNAIRERPVSGLKLCPVWLNDIHSQLNWTRVREVRTPQTATDLQRLVALARAKNLKISCAGGRHAMGGQQFGAGNLHLDLCELNRVLSFDRERGIIEVEAGIQWPQLIEWLIKAQDRGPAAWSIRQKQTGADRLSIGGALAANVHGRGLRMAPFVSDVESFALITPQAEILQCSRAENPDLFRLVIGGYGMFGIIYSVKLRLARRERLRRAVKLTTTETLAADFHDRIQNGFLFGDFQFSIDRDSADFLRKGVFACYEPVEFGHDESEHRQLGARDWRRLLHLAHTSPGEAFEQYARFYLATDGQFYSSDTLQLGHYSDDYHREIDEACRCPEPGSEMISELYVPRAALDSFMTAARAALRRNGARVIYGTVRLIEPDRETFLPWARQNFACVVFNLHCQHNPASLAQSADAFRALIDIALSLGGSFYLTYHRYATRSQLLAAYPELPEFLRLKTKHDPASIFESNWYRHLKQTFPDVSPSENGDTSPKAFPEEP